MAKVQNPKLVGSNLVDCIPQIGECPMGCLECFYNEGRFYRTLNEPLMPNRNAVGDRIVRVNSGHDSNIEKDLVLRETRRYGRKFYNTSLPDFDFEGCPVVFTCNGREPLFVDCMPNVMFVRVRANTWDENQDKLVEWYLRQGVPVVMTFMRYYSEESIPEDRRGDFIYGKHILNEYWKMTPEAERSVMARYKGTGVRRCGTEASSLCVDCRNCELLYWECVRRLGI